MAIQNPVRDRMKALGEFIYERRKKLGKTQSHIARAIGVNESYISRLESGDRFQSINLDTAYKLAEQLDTNVDELARIMKLIK